MSTSAKVSYGKLNFFVTEDFLILNWSYWTLNKILLMQTSVNFL